jgi:hypothetical protein
VARNSPYPLDDVIQFHYPTKTVKNCTGTFEKDEFVKLELIGPEMVDLQNIPTSLVRVILRFVKRKYSSVSLKIQPK